MSAFGPIARKLYLRIWLAAVGAVVLLSLLMGLAWRVAERERERERTPPPPREVMVRNAAGEVIGHAQSEPRRGPGQPLTFEVALADGQQLRIEMPSRFAGRPGADGAPGWRGANGGERPGAERGPPRRMDPWFAWLRPPYGFFWVLGLGGIAVAIGVLPVARRLTQRLEALQRGVQRWGEGDLSVRLPETGQDEVADLSRRFNAAAARVQSLMESQQALLTSQKSLLANASHELRSPLARIRMALALSDSSADSAARAEINRNITELDQLVDEILLASRLDAREADLGTVEEVDLMGLLAEECARVGADFEPGPGATEALVPGVARLLRRAVRNLLENAQRHGRAKPGAGEPGASVTAHLSVADGVAQIHVDDHGPGVPPQQAERIFEPFYSLPGASERDGGVGLGLALVRSIAERHGGSVACANRPEGGARFTLRLPLAGAAPAG